MGRGRDSSIEKSLFILFMIFTFHHQLSLSYSLRSSQYTNVCFHHIHNILYIFVQLKYSILLLASSYTDDNWQENVYISKSNLVSLSLYIYIYIYMYIPRTKKQLCCILFLPQYSIFFLIDSWLSCGNTLEHRCFIMNTNLCAIWKL